MKRALPLVLVLAACGSELSPRPAEGDASARPSTSRAPNVLLVVVDTLRADALGAYGSERDTSPALDGLAASGVRFDRAYTPAPWTMPAVASILTGLHPSAHGVVRPDNAVPEAAVTLAERFAEAGYDTAGVISNPVLKKRFGFAAGSDFWIDRDAKGHEHVSTPGVTQSALRTLRQMAERDAPFFLFLLYFDPHYDYLRHPEFGFASDGAGRLAGGESIAELRELGSDLTAEELAFVRQLYDEEVRFTDDGLAAILNELETLGIADDTVVCFTSDHGEELGEHEWIGHTRHLFEETIRVPLVLRAPDLAPAVLETPVSLVSVAPTLLELAGLQGGPEFHGPSLVSLMKGAEVDLPPVFCEVDFVPLDAALDAKVAFRTAVVVGDSKLIRDETTGQVTLFDLAADPSERSPVDDSARAAELERVLDEARARASEGALEPRTIRVDAAHVELMNGLGYTGEPED